MSTRATPTPAAQDTGQQLTELPLLDPTGLDLQDYNTYVRKVSSGGPLDFRIALGTLIAQAQLFIAQNKPQMRSFAPSAAYQVCFCLGGVFPNDNQGGIYFTVVSTDQDNDGDRIRPNNYIGLVWYKWLI
jgi:hypothetical protein